MAKKIVALKVSPVAAESVPQENGNVVAAQHTIKYEAPFTIPNFSDSEENEFDDELEFDLEPESDDTKPVKPAKSTLAKLREKLVKNGVVPEDAFPLTIEKFQNTVGSGVRTPRTPCTRLLLTEEEITTENIMSAVEAYGPGRYWLTLRNIGGHPIIRQWEVTAGDNIAVANQLSSQPAGTTSIAAVADPFQELDRVLQIVEKLERIRGNRNPEPTTAIDPKTAVASFLMDDPATAKRIISNLMGGAAEPDSTLGLILQNAEPIGKAIESIIASVFANLQAMKSDGQHAQPQQFQPQQFNQTPTVNLNQISENPANQFAAFLVSTMNATPNLNALLPDSIALQLITFSDWVDAQQQSLSISHYLEMIARTDALQAVLLIEQLAQQKITAAPNLVNHWIGLLQHELSQFFVEVKENEPDATPTPSRGMEGTQANS